MSDTQYIKVPVLKKEANISLTIGTQVVQDLQLALTVILEGRDTKDLPKKIADNTISEHWEQAAVSLSGFIHYLYSIAEKDGNVQYREMSAEDIVSTASTPSQS